MIDKEDIETDESIFEELLKVEKELSQREKLNEDNVLSIIENIKIYNLINYYHIPENLKDYIKTNLNNEFEDENFFN